MSSFLLGLVAGFVTSIGVGPITISAVSRSLRNGMKAGMAVAGGAAIMDFLVITLTGLGLGEILSARVVGNVPGLLCGSVLTLGGIWRLANPRKVESFDAVSHRFQPSEEGWLVAHGATGALLYGANPVFVVVWAGIMSVFRNKGLLSAQPSSTVVFALGASIGTVSLFWILLSGVRMLAHRFPLLQYVSTIVPFIDVAVGVVILFQVLVTTTPP